VVYGHGTDPIPVAVVARDFRIAMNGEAGLNTLLSLDVDGKNYLTLARDIQRHPVRNVVTHVDFLIVRRDEVIAAEVGITVVGEALEVQHGDGIVDQQLTPLTIHGSLHVSDIVLPEGVELDIDPETTVVAGQPPRVQTAETGAAEEGAEGAEGGTAAGDAAPSED
jgi:large subunit ribosomal protein L25